MGRRAEQNSNFSSQP